jgi:methylthioribose-1-phosphate isomerase
MRARGEAFRTIWQSPDDPAIVQIIDQRLLPHEYVVSDLTSWQDGADAISNMLVRGAPLIGATAAWSLYLAALSGRSSGEALAEVGRAAAALAETRPTANPVRPKCWLQQMLRRAVLIFPASLMSSTMICRKLQKLMYTGLGVLHVQGPMVKL